MANLTTTSDCVTAALSRAGELTNGNSPFAEKALEFLNIVYTEIVCGASHFLPELAEAWPWARSPSPGTLALLPAYEAGTVALTNSSTTGTFSDAPDAALGSFTGRTLRVDTRSDFYRIASHTAGEASFVLDQAYQDETIAAGAYAAYKLDYALASGVVRLVTPMRVFKAQSLADADGRIEGASPEALDAEFPLTRLTTSVPTKFAQIGETAAGVSTVRFNSTVAAVTRVEYDYIPLPTTLTVSPPSTPLIPREHRVVLMLGAAYWLMIEKEDSRADAYYRMTQSKIQGMLAERKREFKQVNPNFAALSPRQDLIRTRPRLRLSAGPY